MSYESIMALEQNVIITVGRSIHAFMNKEDANHFFMNCDLMEWEECSSVDLCIKLAQKEKGKLFWCVTDIEGIMDDIYYNINHDDIYRLLKGALREAIVAIMDDEKARALREEK